MLDHAEVSVIVAEDQEQVDKVLSLAGELKSLRLIVYEDPLGMSGYRHDMLKSFADVEAAGRAFAEEHPGYFERELEQGGPGDVALIAYTSGTTGRSKGVLLSHANMIATSESFAGVEAVARGDNWLCYLPMGWVGDSIFSLSTSPWSWPPPATAPRAPRPCSATCASWAPARCWRRRASGRTC